MPTRREPPAPDFRPEDSPIAWFGELLLAVDRGDFNRATESQRELSRLGWNVAPRKPPKPRQAAAGEGGGR